MAPVLLRVKGNSMRPTIQSGDIVLINRWAYWFSKPKLKDIVVVKDSIHSHYFVKRVHIIKNGRYLLKGDNKKESVSMAVGKKDIYGKVLMF